MVDGEVQLWPDLKVQIDLEQVYRLEGARYGGQLSNVEGGIGRRPGPGPAVERLHRQLLAEGLGLAQPQAITTAVGVVEIFSGQVRLRPGGHKIGQEVLTSSLLARLARGAQALILAVCTLGPDLENQVEAYSREGHHAEAYILDAVGTALIKSASQDLVNRLEQDYRRQGLKTTIPLGPGHSYWRRLEDQEVVFSLLHPETIGVTLSPIARGLMLPKKSISFVMGVGRELPDSAETHCRYCSYSSSCPLSEIGPERPGGNGQEKS